MLNDIRFYNGISLTFVSLTGFVYNGRQKIELLLIKISDSLNGQVLPTSSKLTNKPIDNIPRSLLIVKTIKPEQD